MKKYLFCKFRVQNLKFCADSRKFCAVMRPRDRAFKKLCWVSVMCHVSHVMQHVSCVICHMSCVKKKYCDKVVELVGGGSVINGAYPELLKRTVTQSHDRAKFSRICAKFYLLNAKLEKQALFHIFGRI